MASSAVAAMATPPRPYVASDIILEARGLVESGGTRSERRKRGLLRSGAEEKPVTGTMFFCSAHCKDANPAWGERHSSSPAVFWSACVMSSASVHGAIVWLVRVANSHVRKDELASSFK